MQAIVFEGERDDVDETPQSLIRCLQPHNKNQSLIFDINPEEDKLNETIEN